MRRLKILIWHIHGSYLNTLARIEHDWYLPIKPDRPEGYGGRGPTFDLPDYVREVPVEQIRDLQLDLVIYQTPKNYFEDRFEILTDQQRRLPKIYLEHNTPKPNAVDTAHPVDDPDVLLVHVTHYNRLMWNNGRTPTLVIEHSVALDPSINYNGYREGGITVVNGMQKRPRVAGYDVFLQARQRVPLDVVGMQSEAFGGLGDIPYRDLHRLVADYRFLFSPIRYTSLPLAVIEAMTIGMPVVALATTELATVIANGKTGYVSCDIDELIERMLFLLTYREEALWLGRNAQVVARERFGLDRFIQDWNRAFALILPTIWTR
ncbi:MAG: glycosyltransferase family 4 protein [Chloroflexi bacterium]|nr:glycosyltransferase family 4 protein [Ktedonobacteraceae bacterium]MBV8822806.1 glycosyltransferase family 4 protein [Ktedonobacteraceae bacterium]MBV9020247.1 glycosyltransferase family 4 protein [Ktedonobacteraceae bacterium]MBV9708558.1 glycosyltransferase family 4 protein [Chloroflexota bacterium]